MRYSTLKTLCGSAALFGLLASSDAVLAQTRDLTIEATRPGANRPRPAPAQTLPVNVSLTPVGPSVLPIGSRLRLRVQSNNNGFGHLYIANASGKVVMLTENLPLRANRAVLLPRAGLVLRATPQTGDNVVYFLATRSRFPGFAGGGFSATPLDIQINAAQFEAQIATRLSDTPRNRWGSTKQTIRVTD